VLGSVILKNIAIGDLTGKVPFEQIFKEDKGKISHSSHGGIQNLEIVNHH
jgi:hypothetical protein